MEGKMNYFLWLIRVSLVCLCLPIVQLILCERVSCMRLPPVEKLTLILLFLMGKVPCTKTVTTKMSRFFFSSFLFLHHRAKTMTHFNFYNFLVGPVPWMDEFF